MTTRLFVFIALFLVGSLSAATRTVHRSFVNGYPAEAARHETGVRLAPKTTYRSAQKTAKKKPAPVPSTALERLCLTLLPPEKVNAAVGFFAPVAKKYMPEFDRFTHAYETSADKTAVVIRYLPTAERALAEARVMPVPPKYEQEKAEYMQLFDTALLSVKAYLAMKQMK